MNLRIASLIKALKADFQMRYEPNFAWVNAVSAALLLPELRAFWPGSSFDENNQALDLSGQARTLANPAVIPATRSTAGLSPYVNFVRANSQYLRRLDEAGLDVTGGLTLFCWAYFDITSMASNVGLLSKWQTTSNDRSYLLYKTNINTPTFNVTSLGTAVSSVGVAGAAVTSAAWYFLAGRFTPSVEVALFVNGTWTTNAVGIPASIFSGAANLLAGAYGGGTPTAFLGGRMALFGVCAAAVPNAIVNAYFEQTRALFGA